MRRVVAETRAGNWASRRVLEKCGLIRIEGSGTEPGAAESAEHGQVVYELTRAHWEARRRAIT